MVKSQEIVKVTSSCVSEHVGWSKRRAFLMPGLRNSLSNDNFCQSITLVLVSFAECFPLWSLELASIPRFPKSQCLASFWHVSTDSGGNVFCDSQFFNMNRQVIGNEIAQQRIFRIQINKRCISIYFWQAKRNQQYCKTGRDGPRSAASHHKGQSTIWEITDQLQCKCYSW